MIRAANQNGRNAALGSGEKEKGEAAELIRNESHAAKVPRWL